MGKNTRKVSSQPNVKSNTLYQVGYGNKELATLLRNVSAAYQVKGGNTFQIRAYDLAADSIEHTGDDIRALWESGNLNQIAGIGAGIANYLDEYFTRGKVEYFDQVFKDIPTSMFDLLSIPGVGPKTAYKLSSAKIESIQDLERKIKNGSLLKEGFGSKTLKNIYSGIEQLKKRSDRILLPIAWNIAQEAVDYLKKHSAVVEADVLGSLRRRLATVGDIDISVASDSPSEVINYFTKFPRVERIVEAGETTATVLLPDGITIDLMVGLPSHYGALLQHFTGSKNHNIHIRQLALEKKLSFSEKGFKDLQYSKIISVKREADVYKMLGMQTPPPELREDQGEVEAALKNELPVLIETSDIQGDLHTHSSWSDGQNSIKQMADAAANLGREYIALTDHSYPNLKYKERLKEIEQYNYSQDKIRVISGLEVNINTDATLQIPNEILSKHDIVFVSIHTSFRQPIEIMTERILKAIENPHVHVLAHPTGRLLLQREGIEADWEQIFKRIVQLGKYIEIDSFPNRLDLTDLLVKKAKSFGVKFTIDSDSHSTEHLNLVDYGISVARRGWLKKNDVINTLPYLALKDILMKH